MLIITLFSKGPTFINIEQRLLQKLLYFNISNYIKELMYLGFEYAFYSPVTLTLGSTKGFFYTSPLIRFNELLKLNFEIKEFNYIFSKKRKNKPFYSTFLKTMNFFNNINPFSTSLYLMANTGAKANWNQICQLIGVRGYLANATGDFFKIPVLNSFNKGLTFFEYFISCYGARKGILDTALKTADAGYLTRRLVESAQDIVIKEYSCGSNNSLEYTFSMNTSGTLSFPLFLIFLGKILKKNLVNYSTCKIIEYKSNYISAPLIHRLIKNKYNYIFKFNLNSLKLCLLGRTICSTCFGYTTFKTNYLGKSVGILAGQVIGEPGTQLTLRTFHTGGVSTSSSVLSKNKNSKSTSKYFYFFNKYKITILTKKGKLKKTKYNKTSYIVHIKKDLNNKLNKYLLFVLNNSFLNYFAFLNKKLIYLKNNIFLTKIFLSFLGVNKLYQRKKTSTINESLMPFYGNILFKKILQLLVKNKNNKWICIALNKTFLFKTYFFKCSLLNTNKLIFKKAKNQRYVKFSLVYNKNFLYSNSYVQHQFLKTTSVVIFKLFFSTNTYSILEEKIKLNKSNYFKKTFKLFKTNVSLITLNKII